MQDGKPLKEAVAFYAVNQHGQFLSVKRSWDDESLPNVWGLPAASRRGEESAEDAVIRAARDKLGLDVELVRFTGEETQDRGEYMIHLQEYEVNILSGTPSLQNSDESASHYDGVQWTNDPEVLREAADNGSLCSRIFLRNQGLLDE